MSRQEYLNGAGQTEKALASAWQGLFESGLSSPDLRFGNALSVLTNDLK